VLGWAAVARSSARERHTVAATAVRLAEEAHAAAAQELETAQELAHRQERFAGARRRREALDAVREEREQLCVRLERGRSAGAVAPALQLRKAAESARGEAREGVTRTRGPLPAELRDATHHLLTEAVRTARQELGSLAAARRAEEQAVALASELDALERDSRADDDLLAEAANWLADWDAVREEHRRRVEHAGEAATRAEQIAGRLGPARGRLEAARRRDGLTERISVAEDALLRARTKAAAAHERWLGLRDRRLRDIAAELAAELRDGQECAVCGAVEHPRPARASADHVDRHTEETALAVHRESEQRREETEHSLRSLCEARAAADTEADGAGTPGLAADAAGLERALATARAAAADAHTAREALDRAEREHTERLAQHEAAARRGAARTSRREALLSQQVLLDKEVVLARGTAASVAERAGDLQIRAGLLEAAAEAARDLEAAAERLAEADARLADACRTAGFPTPQDATAAVLHPAELRALQERLDAWQAEDAAISAELSDPALAAAGVRLPADPARAREALETATRRRLRAVSAADEAATCCAELDRLSARATADARQLAPLRESYERVARLASLAAGTSAENEHRMRLESYVLAARLEQVAAAASVRLHRMSAGRYTLVHSDARASGRGRSGLGLHVIDAWTGSERDTATLSGGESFFASLALALGLADVVTEEAGGTRLDTLFIDEGFGSLDEQTLDDVLDVLDSLREQDRTVGIVSHVPDLRQRIPVQLEVVKGRSGSVVRHRGADASG
jgi:exonuclease SbcC